MPFALVVAEYGGIDGLLPIEKLVEEMVCDIAGEHDEVAGLVVVRPDGTWPELLRRSGSTPQITGSPPERHYRRSHPSLE